MLSLKQGGHKRQLLSPKKLSIYRVNLYGVLHTKINIVGNADNIVRTSISDNVEDIFEKGIH